jgi:hypothetical protein
MTGPPTLSNLMADPGELDVSCLDCHHNTTMPVAALLPRYAAETPFPETWGGFRCSACGSKRVDVRPNWAAGQELNAGISHHQPLSSGPAWDNPYPGIQRCSRLWI